MTHYYTIDKNALQERIFPPLRLPCLQYGLFPIIIYIPAARPDGVGDRIQPAGGARHTAADRRSASMLQLMSPAGSEEAVIAAVQSGADIVYIGAGLTRSEGLGGFSPVSLARALRYCRARGCQTVLALGGLLSDEGLERACSKAVAAAKSGVDAIMVEDIGLARALRSLLPDTPLWGDVRMGVSTADGARAAQSMGLSRVVLAPELTLDQIRAVCAVPNIECIVYVHGHLCFARAGQCHMEAFSEAFRGTEHPKPTTEGWCGEYCRRRFDLGGRMDDYPLSMKDLCLLDHIDALTEAGVCCAAIEGHGHSAEYVAFVTGLYARRINEHASATAEERQQLLDYFAANGLTDAYLRGERETDMHGIGYELNRRQTHEKERFLRSVRKEYIKGERRRIPLTFYAVIQPDMPATFGARDNCGNQVSYKGYEPVDLGRPGIPPSRVRSILYRTAGTPYSCKEVECLVGERMDYPDEAVEEARRELIKQLSEKRREPKTPLIRELPPPVTGKTQTDEPRLICEVSRREQMTEALAACEPDMLYAPLELAAEAEALAPFRAHGVAVAAVLPRAVSEAELPALRALAERAAENGVESLVGGSLGYFGLALELGLPLRGDLGMNATNARSLEWLSQLRLRSATVSPLLSMTQIQALAKPLDVEMVVYGRLPVMVTDQCILRRSAGRCDCERPAVMNGESGGQFPVLREYGCRNVIFDSGKIFLADNAERYLGAGLWGIRLLFSSESPHECVEVTRRYQGGADYTPHGVTRGLYAKGIL